MQKWGLCRINDKIDAEALRKPPLYRCIWEILLAMAQSQIMVVILHLNHLRARECLVLVVIFPKFDLVAFILVSMTKILQKLDMIHQCRKITTSTSTKT